MKKQTNLSVNLHLISWVLRQKMESRELRTLKMNDDLFQVFDCLAPKLSVLRIMFGTFFVQRHWDETINSF